MSNGKPVGQIFVELDLDADRYTRGQRQLLKDAQQASTTLEQNFKNLGIKSAATFDLMRSKALLSFEAIANSSKATANDILRAEEAKNAKLKALNDQQFGGQSGAIDSLKKNWLAASAAVATAAVAIHKAMVYIEEGAKAMQVESSFRIMAESAEVNAERLIASMKAATRETIDDSAMMQKAVKLMTLGYNPEQIERFSKVVITASQIAGTSAAAAYDELADAIGNRAPKALVRMGAVTREQMGIVNAAIEAGADSTALYELAMANLEAKMKMLQGTQDQVAVSMQRMKARTDETTEAIGKGLIIALDYAYRGFEYLAAGVMGLVSAYARYRELIYKVMGDEKQAADNRFIADVAYETRLDLLKRSGQGILDNAEAEKRASKEEIASAKEKVDVQMASMQATIAAKKAADEAKRKAEEEARKSEQVNKKFWEDYKKEVEGAFEFEKFKLEEQLKEFDKYVHDKIALNLWYQSERRKIEVKEFAETAATQFPSEAYGAESARAAAYTANAAASRDFTKSVEEQRAAVRKSDEELSAENWWKTYVEDVEDAARANEIFKDSMNVMSQSTADAMAKMAMGTGNLKDNFNAMIQSIIAGMIRMSTQQSSEALFSYLLKAGGSIASSYFGGETPTGMGTNTDFSGGGSMGSFMALVKHSGGMVDGSGPYREMPAWMVDAAPRLHKGLAADEFPAVLQRGERVIPKDQAAGGSTNNITINVAAPSGRMDRESLASLQAGLYTTLQRAGQRNS